MARSKGLATKAKALAPGRLTSGAEPWHEAIKRKSPETHAEMLDLVNAWVRGEYQMQFPRSTHLRQFLIDEGVIDGEKVSPANFRHWVAQLKSDKQ